MAWQLLKRWAMKNRLEIKADGVAAVEEMDSVE